MGKRQQTKILTDEEEKKFLEEFNRKNPTGLRNYCIYRLMLKQGLRVSETVNLEVEHINFMSRKIEIKESKGAKNRVVWSGKTTEYLDEWLDIRTELIKKGEIPNPLDIQRENDVPEGERSDYFFLTFRGTKVKTSYLRRKIKTIAERAGLDEVDSIHNHSLRHTFATKLLNTDGVNIRKVQNLLGHENLTTTQEYTHIIDEEDLKDVMVRYDSD